MKNPYVKWTLIILGILALIAIIYFLIKALKPQPVYPPGGNPPPSGGIWDALGNIDWANIFGGGKKCDKNNPGFQKDGVYNPDKCGRAPGLECDPNRPGWNLGGFPDTSCP